MFSKGFNRKRVCTITINKLFIIRNNDILYSRIREYVTGGCYYDVPLFYESLNSRIVISFKPKFKDLNPKPEFDLVLNKNWTYDQVCGTFI